MQKQKYFRRYLKRLLEGEKELRQQDKRCHALFPDTISKLFKV